MLYLAGKYLSEKFHLWTAEAMSREYIIKEIKFKSYIRFFELKITYCFNLVVG